MPREPEDDAAREQEETAADLADRAAESVDRRYDATKELHLGDTERDGDDER
jgi:hypothetical protein